MKKPGPKFPPSNYHMRFYDFHENHILFCFLSEKGDKRNFISFGVAIRNEKDAPNPRRARYIAYVRALHAAKNKHSSRTWRGWLMYGKATAADSTTIESFASMLRLEDARLEHHLLFDKTAAAVLAHLKGESDR